MGSTITVMITKKYETLSVDDRSKGFGHATGFSRSLFPRFEWTVIESLSHKYKITQRELIVVFNKFLTHEEVYLREFRVRTQDCKQTFLMKSRLQREQADVVIPIMFLKDFVGLEKPASSEEVTFTRFIVMSYIFGSQTVPDLIVDFIAMVKEKLKVGTDSVVHFFSMEQLLVVMMEDMQRTAARIILERCLKRQSNDPDISVISIVKLAMKFPVLFYSLQRFRKHLNRAIFGDAFWQKEREPVGTQIHGIEEYTVRVEEHYHDEKSAVRYSSRSLISDAVLLQYVRVLEVQQQQQQQKGGVGDVRQAGQFDSNTGTAEVHKNLSVSTVTLNTTTDATGIAAALSSSPSPSTSLLGNSNISSRKIEGGQSLADKLPGKLAVRTAGAEARSARKDREMKTKYFGAVHKCSSAFQSASLAAGEALIHAHRQRQRQNRKVVQNGEGTTGTVGGHGRDSPFAAISEGDEGDEGDNSVTESALWDEGSRDEDGPAVSIDESEVISEDSEALYLRRQQEKLRFKQIEKDIKAKFQATKAVAASSKEFMVVDTLHIPVQFITSDIAAVLKDTFGYELSRQLIVDSELPVEYDAPFVNRALGADPVTQPAGAVHIIRSLGSTAGTHESTKYNTQVYVDGETQTIYDEGTHRNFQFDCTSGKTTWAKTVVAPNGAVLREVFH